MREEPKGMREPPMDVTELVAKVIRFTSFVRGVAASNNNRAIMEYAEAMEKETQRFVRDYKEKNDEAG